MNMAAGQRDDLVALLQEQITLVCSRMVDAVGPLQRDAPPASIKGEPVVVPAAAARDVVVRHPPLLLPDVICRQRTDKTLLL